QDVRPARASSGVSLDFTNNPHGQFGLCSDWPGIRHLVQKWLETHHDDISAAAAALAQMAPAGITGQDWASVCSSMLVPLIDNATAGSQAGHHELSQRLAETGALPMFGFPTDVRYLHLSRPQAAYPWPPAGVIDRDIAMAVSQFAPLSEVVRDGRVHPVVGIAAFIPTRPRPRPEDDALGIQRVVSVCRSCSFVEEPPGQDDGPDGPCPRCGAAPGTYQTIQV